MIDKYIFKKAEHSSQKNLLLALKRSSNIAITENIIRITNIPVTIFHIIDTIQATNAAERCSPLSDPRYLGNNPTRDSDIVVKNGKNLKHSGLTSTQEGNIRNDTTKIQMVKIFLLLNK